MAIPPFAMRRIDSLANRDNLFSPLPFLCFPLSFSCPIALKKTSNTILNKNGDKGYFCFVLNLRLVIRHHYDVGYRFVRCNLVHNIAIK